ncbi:MAG: antirestriction protein ArdA [Bacteroidota bacterium]
MNATDTPRVYVACLAAYNNGKLHGTWIDAHQDADDIRAEIAAMLKESPEPDAEEWAIHDFENFGGLRLSEGEDIEQLVELAELITEHGDVFAKLVDHVGGLQYLEHAKTLMEEEYAGAHGSLEDFACELLEDTGQLESVPENLRPYFDCEKFGRDLELGGDVFTVDGENGQVHVFWNR